MTKLALSLSRLEISISKQKTMTDYQIENSDSELHALQVIEQLQKDPGKRGVSPSQRDFAKALNMSVGMTNSIIKRLVNKGLLVIHKINGRNLSYALTPEGTREVAKRSYRYLRRTIGNVVRWKDAIDEAVSNAKLRGCSRVLLVGDSDLDFIVEHSAGRHGLMFVRSQGNIPGSRQGKNSQYIIVISEQYTDADIVADFPSDSIVLYLQHLIVS